MSPDLDNLTIATTLMRLHLDKFVSTDFNVQTHRMDDNLFVH